MIGSAYAMMVNASKEVVVFFEQLLLDINGDDTTADRTDAVVDSNTTLLLDDVGDSSI
jgi:hypothetical protein